MVEDTADVLTADAAGYSTNQVAYVGPTTGTEKILAEVGIDESELADLRVQGAVGPAYER